MCFGRDHRAAIDITDFIYSSYVSPDTWEMGIVWLGVVNGSIMEERC